MPQAALGPHVQEALIDIVRRAGEAILEIYQSDFAVTAKDDDSPLTQADLAAHRIIVAGLEALEPRLPIISEESRPPPFSERAAWPRYWLVDPLDGTKEFVSRNGEFTVNVALVHQGEPIFGIVYAPVLGWLYVGGEGLGARKSMVRVGWDDRSPRR